MNRQIIPLDDDAWLFGQVARRPFTAPDVNDLGHVNDWWPATIPGNVRTDLLALDRIPDPFFGSGYQESLWVEDVDWWYRRSLQATPLQPDQRAFLCFSGIDYLSAIFINGQALTRHEGMFSPQTVEVTEALRSGQAEVAVRLWGSGALPTRQLTWRQRLWERMIGPLYNSWVGIYPDRTATLKGQMAFGWDFAPPIRTMGLWDEVTLLICGPVFIRQARLTPDLSRPTVSLILDSTEPRPVSLTIRLRPANFSGPAYGPFEITRQIPAGVSHHHFDLHLPNAAPWQPWDRGHPSLYDVEISLATPTGERLDQTTLRTGLRSVALHGWQFRLNGQREFMRGVNWVPADCFPGRLRRADYRCLLTQVKASGANLLRVWGGGLREKRAFYELCDELGLLVWQEFPFACLFLGSYPRNQSYLRQVEAECGAIVRHIGHHPSVILWCGGNEFSGWRNRPLIERLARVVQENDGRRPFLPTSPSALDGGDAHNWHVWHGNAAFRAYQNETARFLSEFGLQALPHQATLEAMLPDPTQDWASHHADPPTLIRYADLFNQRLSNPKKQSLHLSISNPPIPPSPHLQSANLPISNIQSLILASQQAQAAALQTAIEHMRRRKGEAGGVCLWQLNEPWPAISWAIIDYFGRPKLAYERLKDWYNPILISLNFPVGRQWRSGDVFRAEVWAINDSLQPYTDCALQIDLDGRPIHTQVIDVPADSSRRVGRITTRLTRKPQRLTLTLHRHLRILARNRYDLTWHDSTRISLYRRFRRLVADWVLR